MHPAPLMKKFAASCSVALLAACSSPTDPTATRNIVLEGDFRSSVSAGQPLILDVTLINLGRRTFVVAGHCFSQVKITDEAGNVVVQGTTNNCTAILNRVDLRPNQVMREQMTLPVLPSGRYTARLHTIVENNGRYPVWSNTRVFVVQ